jgi:sorbose reductase
LKASEVAIEALSSSFPTAKIHQYPVDVTSEEAVSTAITSAHTAMGSISMLLCFAGIVGCVHTIDVAAPAFRKVIDVNLTGSFLCAQAAARFMQVEGGGSILFTASISAHATNYPQPQAAYNVSKAAVLHLTQNLAAEWAVYGIRVNCVSPGYMDTVLNAGDNLQAVRDVWASRNPMGRMGDIEEITGPVVMLMSPRAGRYTNGANLTVDGGAMCF